MKLSKLYSRSSTGKISTWEIEILGNKYRTISGFEGMKLVTSEWKVCAAKSYCTAEEQAMKEATALHRKKMEAGSFENISDIDDETYFEPMLAHDWHKEKHKVKYPVYSQPKLDGIRCIVKKDGMWSRNGKRIVSAPHIFEAMKSLFKDNPDLIFDGELYANKFANDFNAICSLVKKTKPTAEDLAESARSIQYWIYDVPSEPGAFTKRINVLDILIMHSVLPNCCIIVPTVKVENENKLYSYYEIYIDQGYEGQIVRLDKPYENKRSKSLLKHKSFIDEEYTILGVEEGIGNKTGMVGSFIFETKDGKRFNASPKFNWEECTRMWKERDQLIGKLATVKYFNLTPGDHPVPRFPYVIQIDRWDI